MKKLKLNKIKLNTILLGEFILITCFPLKLNRNEVHFFNKEEQNLVVSDIDFSLQTPKSFQKYLSSPEGYKVLDYDFSRDNFHNIENILYTNTINLTTSNKTAFPNNSLQEESGIYRPYNHSIVVCNISFELFTNNQVKLLTAPDGYEVIKYNYDRNNGINYEIILYENNESVKVHNINDFGLPLQSKKTKDYYDIGEETMAVIKNKNSLIFNASEEKLNCPGIYKIIDYDYNRTLDSEIETITYKNTVKISKETLLPLEEPKEENDYLVNIEKRLLDEPKKVEFLENPYDYNLISYSADYNKYYEYDTKLYQKKK